MSEGWSLQQNHRENHTFRTASLAAMLVELHAHARDVTLSKDVFEFNMV
jgi:hypothetical protein